MNRFCLIVCLLLAWSTARADTPAETLWNAWNDTLKAAPSLTGRVEMFENGALTMQWRFKALKPNLYEFIGWMEKRGNGSQEIFYYPDRKEYESFPASPSSMQNVIWELPGCEPFTSRSSKPHRIVGTMASVMFHEVACVAIPLYEEVEKDAKAAASDLHETVYLDSKSGLLVGYEQSFALKDEGGRKHIHTVLYHDLHLDVPLTPTQFGWEPPADAKKAISGPSAAALSAGNDSPRFRLKTPDGKRIALADLLAKNRAVMVCFWSYG